MTDLALAIRYLRARPLVTILTILSVTLGLGLATVVLILTRQAKATLREETTYWDIAVGAKGSPLQLVLNGLYYLDSPTGNIPATIWKDMKNDPSVEMAVPLTMGDNYLGTPIVGTTTDFFKARGIASGIPPLAQGQFFTTTMQVVVGADVARRHNLHVGDSMVGAHGWVTGGDLHTATPYTVVGILAPMGGCVDRAIYTDYQSVYIVHEHKDPDDEPGAANSGKPPEVKINRSEITVLLIKMKHMGARYQMADYITKNDPAMATVPVDQVDRIERAFIDPMESVLITVAYLVVIVAALSILISLYLTIHQRRRDIAIQRALGATPGDVFRLITLEAALLTGAGVIIGWLAGHGLVAAAGTFAVDKFGIMPHAWAVSPEEAIIAVSVWVLGILAGILPAAVAYRLPVAGIWSRE